MAWRLAHSLAILKAEVDARWPDRSTVSDGTIGDAAHASRDSDHNPWVIDDHGDGVVRARDVTADGIDPDWYAEHLRQLGASGDRRLNPDGYVIWNRRIASAGHAPAWQWHPYTGSNQHTHHVHLSVTTVQAGYDSGAPWGIAGDPEEFTMDAAATKAFSDLMKEVKGLRARVEELEKDRLEPTTKRVRLLAEKNGIRV